MKEVIYHCDICHKKIWRPVGSFKYVEPKPHQEGFDMHQVTEHDLDLCDTCGQKILELIDQLKESEG